MEPNFKMLYAMVIMIWQMLSVNISDVTIITMENVDYHCITYNINKYEAINFLESSVPEDRGYILS